MGKNEKKFGSIFQNVLNARDKSFYLILGGKSSSLQVIPLLLFLSV